MTDINDAVYAKRVEIFENLIRYLTDHMVGHCIVGDTSSLGAILDGDIDFVIENKVDIHKLVDDFCRAHDYQLVQSLQHEVTAWYFVIFAWSSDGVPVFVQPDICTDYMRNGLRFIAADEILTATRPLSGMTGINADIMVAGSDIEFCYYLTKKIDKGGFNEQQLVHLQAQWDADPSGCRKILHRFWSRKNTDLIAKSAQSGDWTAVKNNLYELKSELNAGLSASLKLRFAEFIRRLGRLIRPTGLCIAVMGPDGCGKSSVIDEITPLIAPAFRRTAYFHLRPMVFVGNKGNGAPVTDPHKLPARNWLISQIKLCYFLFDYTVGYFLKTRPLLVRSTFIIFDRYYDDLLADPKRYRLPGSLLLAGLVARLIPKPDIMILLDAPTDVLRSRKIEVSYEETDSQRQRYKKMISAMGNGVVINANQPLTDVVNDVTQVIVGFMDNKLQRNLEK